MGPVRRADHTHSPSPIPSEAAVSGWISTHVAQALVTRVEDPLQERQLRSRTARDGKGLEEHEHEGIVARPFGPSSRGHPRVPFKNGVCPELEASGASFQHAGPVPVIVEGVPPAARFLRLLPQLLGGPITRRPPACPSIMRTHASSKAVPMIAPRFCS